MKIKTGDKVKCVVPDSKNALTLNKVYIVTDTEASVYHNIFYYVRVDIKSTDGIDMWWNCDRFTLMPAVTITLPDELFEL